MMHKMKVFFFDEVKRTGFIGSEKRMDYASLLVEKRKIAIIWHILQWLEHFQVYNLKYIVYPNPFHTLHAVSEYLQFL